MILVHILRDGVILVPPFPAPKIAKLMHARSVLPTDHFWHEGMSEWQLVSTRWEPDDGSSTALAARTTPATTLSAMATRAAHEHAPVIVSRRNRASLLHECKKRYHETLVPWSRQDATPQAT